jgi:hypothetical protein
MYIIVFSLVIMIDEVDDTTTVDDGWMDDDSFVVLFV